MDFVRSGLDFGVQGGQFGFFLEVVVSGGHFRHRTQTNYQLWGRGQVWFRGVAKNDVSLVGDSLKTNTQTVYGVQ